MNNLKLAYSLNAPPYFTGVAEAVSIHDTLDLVWKLMPWADTVYAVADDTPSARGDLAAYEELRRFYPGKSLRVLSLAKMTWDELAQNLDDLAPSCAVLLLSAYRDAGGAEKSFAQGLELILGHSAVPVFHLWEHGLGEGVLGGKVISHYEQGYAAGGLALKVLDGVPVSDIPVVSGDEANRIIVDHVVMRHFGLDEKALPEGAKVLNATVGPVGQVSHGTALHRRQSGHPDLCVGRAFRHGPQAQGGAQGAVAHRTTLSVDLRRRPGRHLGLGHAHGRGHLGPALL